MQSHHVQQQLLNPSSYVNENGGDVVVSPERRNILHHAFISNRVRPWVIRERATGRVWPGATSGTASRGLNITADKWKIEGGESEKERVWRWVEETMADAPRTRW